MKYKIIISDILTAFEQGLINQEQAESKLFDLLKVNRSLPTKEEMESEIKKEFIEKNLELETKQTLFKWGFKTCYYWLKTKQI